MPWVAVDDPNEIAFAEQQLAGKSSGGKYLGPQFAVQDRTALNAIREATAPAADTMNEYRQAEGAAKRLGTGPWRGRLLDAAIPEERGGFGDALGAALVGGPMKLFGALPQQTIDDFQRLKGLQSQRVLTTQMAQKGPQTESDAARMQLTEVSPYKSLAANQSVINQGGRKAFLESKKTGFYTQWANRFGLNGLNERGQSVDDVWNGVRDKVYRGGGQKTPPMKRTKPRVIDFNSLPE